jgi:hypothetical protein
VRTLTVALVFSILAIIVTACNKSGQSSDSSSGSSGTQKSVSKPAAGPKAKSACDLMTPTEIAGFLKVAEVKKDDVESGKNETTKVDICNWYVKKDSTEGVEFLLRQAESDDEGSRMLVFSSARGDAVEHNVERDQKAEKLSGVGDEAIYSPYPVGKGGTIAMRVGPSAVTIIGSASRDDLISMAKLMAGRM